MAIKTPGAVRKRPGSAAAPEEDAGVGSEKRILCRALSNRRPKTLHVRAAIAWPVSSLRNRVRVSVVLLSTGLVSMDE